MLEPVRTSVTDELRQALHHYADAGAGALDARLGSLEREWDLERALEAQAALAGLASLALTATRGLTWSWLPAAVFGLLLQNALQGWSPPVPLLRRFGFRSREEIDQEILGLRLLRGDFRDVVATGAPAERARRALDALQAHPPVPVPAPSWRKKLEVIRTRRDYAPMRATRAASGDLRAENFIEHVKSKWRPAEDEQLDKALGSVLAQLKWRLSPGQADPLFAHLPRTIAKVAERERPQAYALAEVSKRSVDADEFFNEVTNETGLSRPDVEKATAAIFSSMKRQIPAAQNRAMRSMLPKGLKRVWLRA